MTCSLFKQVEPNDETAHSAFSNQQSAIRSRQTALGKPLSANQGRRSTGSVVRKELNYFTAVAASNVLATHVLAE